MVRQTSSPREAGADDGRMAMFCFYSLQRTRAIARMKEGLQARLGARMGGDWVECKMKWMVINLGHGESIKSRFLTPICLPPFFGFACCTFLDDCRLLHTHPCHGLLFAALTLH